MRVNTLVPSVLREAESEGTSVSGERNDVSRRCRHQGRRCRNRRRHCHRRDQRGEPVGRQQVRELTQQVVQERELFPAQRVP